MSQPSPDSTVAGFTPRLSQPFPDTADILRNDRFADCIRVGVGMTITDGIGRILMLAHNESDKCQQDALGPVTETVQWSPRNGGYEAESTLHTMARATREELLTDGNALAMKAQERGGWFIDKVAVGDRYPGQFILGIFAVLHLKTATAEALVESFEGSDEISRLTLMRRDEIRAHTNLRSLTLPILRGVGRRGLLMPTGKLQNISLPHVAAAIGSSDTIPPRERIIVAS